MWPEGFGAIDELNRTAGGRLSSSIVPDCLAVLSKLAGVAVTADVGCLGHQTSHYLQLFGVAGFSCLRTWPWFR